MNKRKLLSRILSVVGLAMIAIGTVAFVADDAIGGYGWFAYVIYLSGIFFPVIGSGLAARGAFLGKSRYRIFLYVALGLTVFGEIALLVVFFNMDNPDLAPWWPFVAFRFPIGAILSLVGAVLVVFESFHRPPVPQDTVGTG